MNTLYTAEIFVCVYVSATGQNLAKTVYLANVLHVAHENTTLYPPLPVRCCPSVVYYTSLLA